MNFEIFVLCKKVFGENYTDEDEMFGKTWMYFPDGDGVPQIAYLTEPDPRGRGRSQQSVRSMVRFELYTT